MAEDPNVTIMKQLYSKLAGTLAVGSNQAIPGQNFLMLANPGIFLDPKLDLSNADDAYLFSSQLDVIPSANWMYGATPNLLSNLYSQILQFKELPIVTLSPAQQKQLKAAQDLLMDGNGDPSNQYDKYLRYQSNYSDALAAYNLGQIDAHNKGTPLDPKLLTALNTARQQWQTFGYKNQIEQAQATIANLTALDPNNWWQQLQNNFANNQKTTSTGATLFPTQTFPKYESFFGDKGWTKFTFDQSDVTNQETSSSLKTGGGGSAGWGLWRVSASADYSKDTQFSSSDVSQLEIQVEIMRATIQRPWMDGTVFQSRGWRWGEGAPVASQLVSDGASPNPAGLMPFLVTGLLLSRNLVLRGSFSHQDQTVVDTALSAGASIGWGPWSLSGHYNKSTHSAVSHANSAANGVSNPDVQIIGFLCSTLSRCPNPDPTLEWPSPLTLAHLPEYAKAGVAMRAAVRRAFGY